MNKKGTSTVETVLIIVILIALVLIFKNTIVDFVSGILDKIGRTDQIFDPSVIAH